MCHVRKTTAHTPRRSSTPFQSSEKDNCHVPCTSTEALSGLESNGASSGTSLAQEIYDATRDRHASNNESRALVRVEEPTKRSMKAPHRHQRGYAACSRGVAAHSFPRRVKVPTTSGMVPLVDC
eukprot:3380131-Pleurochrysis_carterae.AAC.4